MELSKLEIKLNANDRVLRDKLTQLSPIAHKKLLEHLEKSAPDPWARHITRRGAMEMAIAIAHEYPGSTSVILGVTAVSLDRLFYSQDGLHHCLDDYLTNRLMDRRGYASEKYKLRLFNRSQIVGYPATLRPEHFDGVKVDFVLVEDGAANGRTWEHLLRRIRPLPGAENNIIYIVDDEADE